jgi:nucleoid-associated protein YgaU/chemotaxis signal transduction protein
MSDFSEDRKLLQFSVGPVLCCADSVSIHRIIEPPEHLVHLPGHTKHPAIFRHEGRMASVIDMRSLFGLSADPEKKNTEKLIIVETPEGLFAYWVDAVSSIFSDSEGKWGLLPSVVPRNLFDAAFNLQGKLILHVDFNHIVHAEATPWVYESGLYPKSISETPESYELESSTETRVSDDHPEIISKSKKPVVKDQAVEAPAPDIQRERVEPVVRESHIKPAAQSVHIPAVHERHESVVPKSRAEPPVERSSNKRDYGQAVAYESATEQEVSGVTSKSVPPAQSDEEGSGWLLPVFVLLVLLLGVGYVVSSFMGEEKAAPSLVRAPDMEIAKQEPALAPEVLTETETESEVMAPQEPEAETMEMPLTEETEASSSIEREGDTVTITVYEDVAPAIVVAMENSAEGVQPEKVVVLSAGQSAASTDEASIHESTGDRETLELGWSHHRQAQVNVGAMFVQGDTQEQRGQVVPEPMKPVLVVEEIIHIVAKGDTLWDIAGRYIHDPFRYPELARLSKISNPDLIYPGDRVRIRIIRHRSWDSLQ